MIHYFEMRNQSWGGQNTTSGGYLMVSLALWVTSACLGHTGPEHRPLTSSKLTFFQMIHFFQPVFNQIWIISKSRSGIFHRFEEGPCPVTVSNFEVHRPNDSDAGFCGSLNPGPEPGTRGQCFVSQIESVSFVGEIFDANTLLGTESRGRRLI